MITRAVLDELIGLDLRPAVSILMPTHRAGPEIRQDPIRLKDLLREVERQLEDRGLAANEISRLVGPGHDLVADRAFWRHQEDGLALYAAPNFFRSYHAPQPFRELAVVSERFHVTQIFPLLSIDRHFYVLALSQKDIRLIEATRTTAAELDLGDLPRTLSEAVLSDTPEQGLQQHLGTVVGGSRGAVFHGYDPGLDDHKESIREFFHRIDRGIRPLLSDRTAPLVLAGVDFLLPIYREANTHPGLLAKGVLGNPETLSVAALQSRAWELVRPHLEAAQAARADRYQDLVGTGRASADLPTVLRAAFEGRVNELFVAPAQRWGAFEPGSGAVSLRDRPGGMAEDLLNLAAIYTFQRSGTVHVLDGQHVPGGGEIAATFRY